MSVAAAVRLDASPSAVRTAVAEFLRIDPAAIEAGMPLTAYGIDSLGALELIASLEDRFDCRLPESLLTDCPDLDRLTSALNDPIRRNGGGTLELATHGGVARMIADARLPDDIRPLAAPAPRTTHGGPVLLTGATGFLGAAILRDLIDAGFDVVCLVRSAGEPSVSRVRSNLQRYGLWREDDARQVTAVAGDIERPRLGLSSDDYGRLASNVGAIFHAAADVNWVSAYEGLRSANVAATTELIRFASETVRKRFHFVSSLSVCFAHGGPPDVTEDMEMLPWVDRLPLGYAQSKCVAEALVREAANRGLPAQIYRPALLAGHSASGAMNTDDLIAALLRGCIRMGAAPDLDWVFDAVPVDTAAATIVKLARTCRPGCQTFHLRHPRPRHWRECVLWTNIFGYPVRLEPYPLWLDRLAREARAGDHPLHRLRGFFSRRIAGLTTPEHYEEHVRSRVLSSATRSSERAAGIQYPALDAERLDSYLSDLIRRDALAPPAKPVAVQRQRRPADWTDRLEPLLRRHFEDEGLSIAGVEAERVGSEHSIISELTGWKRKGQAGLWRASLTLRRQERFEPLHLMVKVKPPDTDAIDVAQTTADVVNPSVARELARFRDRIGLRGSHVREIEVYALQSDVRFRRHMPTCYGTWQDEQAESWGMLLERLDGMEAMDATGDPRAWTAARVEAAIDGVAGMHAAWLGRERELMAAPWIGYVPSASGAVEMTPLWAALARHAAPMFAKWSGPALVTAHAALVRSMSLWWPAIEALPRTLIHHDFNTRNIAIRPAAEGPRLVAYDWELATVGAPQRDLAELLCFVFPIEAGADELHRLVERHRLRLEQQSGVAMPAALWFEGFRSALNDVLVSRLAFYALIHRIRPQAFLPRVVNTWLRLHTLVQSCRRTRA
ncbi:MAG TPA: thioester reductase domain-containing protein [Vicinamibacterales bacterium]|nr:thioester reductase domain-containing protein [Vicinamibacterales bacterium]